MSPFLDSLVVRIIVSPVLIILICCWPLIYLRVVTLGLFHDLDILVHVYGVFLPPIR